MTIENFGYGDSEEGNGFARDSSSGFYTDDERTVEVSARKTVEDIIPLKRKLSHPFLSYDHKADICIDILRGIGEGRDDCFEINLRRMRQWSKYGMCDLGKTVIEMVIFGSDVPICHYLMPGEGFLASVYLGGEGKYGFLYNEELERSDFRMLSEFHMLSVIDSTDPEKEVGLMTSFTWSTKKVYSSFIKGSPNLDVVKNLLLADETRWRAGIMD